MAIAYNILVRWDHRTGEFFSPSALLQRSVAPHKSIIVPSLSTLVSAWHGSPYWKMRSSKNIFEIKIEFSRRSVYTFCCADRLSRKENTAPPTEVSRQGPQVALPPQKSPLGCIMRTPFVVRPSISWFSVHFVAFSYKKKCKNPITIWKLSKSFSLIFINVWLTPKNIFLEESKPAA